MAADESSDPKRTAIEELERCRRAFESSGNYSALLVAVPLCCEADTCPRWVANALVSIIETELAERVGLVGRWSQHHEKDLIDLARAEGIHDARRHGFTWEEAAEFVAEYFGPTAAGGVGPDAMMKSYQRVRERGGLPLIEWRAARRRGALAPRAELGRYDSAGELEDCQPPAAHAAAVRAKFLERVRVAGRLRGVPSSDND